MSPPATPATMMATNASARALGDGKAETRDEPMDRS